MPTLEFEDISSLDLKDFTKVTLVRDPVRRLLSSYVNRVISQKRLSEEFIQNSKFESMELHPNPAPDFFFRNIRKYQEISIDIAHHTIPISDFIGDDLSFYDKVFKFEELDRFIDYLSATLQEDLLLPKSQETLDPLYFTDLTIETQEVILNYCSADYELLKRYYKKPNGFGD